MEIQICLLEARKSITHSTFTSHFRANEHMKNIA